MSPAELHAAFVAGETLPELSRRSGIDAETVMLRVVRFAEQAGLPDPRLPRERRAYELREKGLTWQAIADILGFTGHKTSLCAAGRYAEANDLRWPVVLDQVDTDPPGREAYELRTQGRSWTEVARAAGYDRPLTALVAAKRHALGAGAIWPIALPASSRPKREARPRSPADPLPGQEVYELRRSGRSWEEVAKLSRHLSVPNATMAAKRYAKATGVAWPIELPPTDPAVLPRRAYDLRVEGQTWPQIAKSLGFTSSNHATTTARRMAIETGLPWPVPTPGRTKSADAVEPMSDEDLHMEYVAGEQVKSLARRTGLAPHTVLARIRRFAAAHGMPSLWGENPRQREVDPEVAVRMRRAYELRQEGHGWDAVAELTGYASYSVAYRAASAFADDYRLPWPVDGKSEDDGRWRAKLAYELRSRRRPWTEVALLAGYKTPSVAAALAAAYAKRSGSKWPLR